MKRVVMYVYGNILTDARVKRAATSLAEQYDVTLLSSDCGINVEDNCYHNVLLKCKKKGIRGFFQSVWEAFKVIKRSCPDILYAHDYYSALLVRLLLKRKYCQKIIYDAHELIIPEKKQNDSRLSFFYRIERSIINKVDLVICASRERALLMKHFYHLDAHPLVIENISYLSTDFDLTLLAQHREIESFFSDPTPTFVYAGVVSKGRKLQMLLDLAIKIAPAVKLLVIGKGDALTDIIEKAQGQSKLKYCFTGVVPYEALGVILSKCDVGYIYYPVDNLNNLYCASNKVYEYASVGLPVVSNKNPTISRILEEAGIGEASDDLDAALSKVLLNLDKYKSHCKAFVDANSWDKTKQILLAHLDKL